MKLEGKKEFIAKTLGIGKGRVILNSTRLSDIKESLTRQDIRDLLSQGAILIREPKGRKKVEKRNRVRRAGSIRKRPRDKKREYILITRKLRRFIEHLRTQGKLPKESYEKLRKNIRARAFHSLSHLKEHLAMEAKK